MSTLLTIAKIAKANRLSKLLLSKPIRNTGVFKSENFTKKYIVNEMFNSKVITLTKDNNYKNHIIYLHGGSFTDEAVFVHRIFIERILTKYETKVSFIDYPLTPENDYHVIQKFTLNAIKNLIQTYSQDTFYIMGDSAGGGLAVSMLQKLYKINIHIEKTILLSPWVDVSMSNPDIEKQLKTDFTLNIDSIKKCGIAYASKTKTTCGSVSPIYGNLNNLGSLLIYTSDNELLFPDIVKFHILVNKSKNSSSKLIVGNNLCHVYPLLIIKETKGIIKEMMNYLSIK